MASGAESSDLDLRLVRYFVAVAENEHFGRAAAALHIAQPALSRRIRRLEHQLGARLFHRGPRGTRLTDPGAAFLPHARALLTRAAAASAEVLAAVRPESLTIGFTSNLIVTPAVRALRRARPGVEVSTRHLAWDEPHPALHERRVDAVVARLPFPDDGLEITALYDEPRVLVVPLDHPAAHRRSVPFAEVADGVFAEFGDEAWDAFWRVDPRPDGTRAGSGPAARSVEDNLALVADGTAVTLAPASVPGTRLRPDVAVVPVEDVAPTRAVLAVRAGDDDPTLAAFRRAAIAHLTSPTAHRGPRPEDRS